MKTGFGIQNALAKMMIPGIAFLVLATLSLFNSAAEAKETEVLLLHTNNVTGHLFPCPT